MQGQTPAFNRQPFPFRTSRSHISIPGAGISLSMVLSYLRPLLGDDAPHVSGEITGSDKGTFWVTIRLNGFELYKSVTPADLGELEQELEKAAQKIVQETEEYAYATYLYPEHTDDAKQVITHIIDNKPESDIDTIRAYNLWGLILHDEGDHDGAIRKFEKSIYLADQYGFASFAAPHINLGNTLVDSRQVKDIRDAIKQYRRAIELQPDSADARIRLGHALLKGIEKELVPEGEGLESAIDSYLTAIRLEHDNNNAFRNLIIALKRVDPTASDVATAASQYNLHQLGLFSKYAVAARRLGGWYMKTGQYDDAIEMYKKAQSWSPSETVDLNPELAEAWYAKGIKLMDEGKRDEACSVFDTARSLMPKEAAYRTAARHYNLTWSKNRRSRHSYQPSCRTH